MAIPTAVVFDIDGTLAVSKTRMTEDMGLLIARLSALRPVGIMSGGSFLQFETQIMPALPSNTPKENLYLFPTSAAQGYTYTNGHWSQWYTHAFTPDERRKVFGAFDGALQETGLDKPPAHIWGERLEDRGTQITFSALGQKAPIEEKQAWDPDQKKRAPLAEKLRVLLPDFTVAVNATTSVDVTHKGITKAYGLERFAHILGLPIPSMVYVGDALFPGGNDSVVMPTGVETFPVSGPNDTMDFIQSLLSELAQ